MRESQRIASRKYDKEHYIWKTFMLEKELVAKFVDVCKDNNISQAGVIRAAMRETIAKYDKGEA